MSVAVQMMVVVPVTNTGGASLETLAMPQLSEATGVPRLMLVVVHWPKLALVRTLAGQVMSGGWASRIVTGCAQVAVLPLTSVAVQCTSVVPTGNCAGASFVMLATLQLSLADGEPSVMPVAKHWPASALLVT